MSDIDKHGDGDPHIAEFELCHNPEEVLRIGRDFQRQDTYRGAQHDTVKLLCDTIEYLRDRLSKPVGNAAEHAMTLDEAIAHAEDVADRCDTSCGREHRQLADWLKELRDMKRRNIGNAAALREACAKMYDLLMLRGDGKAYCILSWDEFNESQKMLRTALAAPARNCDRFTDEIDTQIAFLNEVWLISVDRKTMLVRDKYENWSDEMRAKYGRWLLSPATERKG